MAEAEIFKVYSTTSDYIAELPVRNGNLIFVTDVQKIYLDTHGNRLSYDTIQVFHTEEERTQFLSPLEGFYFVEDTSIMYRWKDGEWLQITSGNVNPIFFGDVDSFPTIGNPTTLYIAAHGTYRWNNLTQEYDLVANKTTWETLD